MAIKNSPIRMTSKRKVAAENAENRASLTDEQQISKLDGMFGEGKGAQKERAMLAKRIAEASTAKDIKVAAKKEER